MYNAGMAQAAHSCDKQCSTCCMPMALQCPRRDSCVFAVTGICGSIGSGAVPWPCHWPMHTTRSRSVPANAAAAASLRTYVDVLQSNPA